MFRKSFISFVFITAIAFAAQTAVFAQYAPVSGTVEVQKADNTREPVAGALIEVYRVDIKAGFPSAKTGKKGEFSFAGLQLGATYLFSISAPGCAPIVYPNVKAGMEKLLITLDPGDGRKLTEDEARQAGTAKAASSGTTELTAEQKKEFAALEAKNKEISEKNKKIQDADELARKSYEEGQAALQSENYDLAISKYNVGIEAVPDFVGSTPILLAGKMNALKAKGFKIYREGNSSTDIEIRKAKYDEANKFYDEALKSFQQAISIIINAEAAANPADQKKRDSLKSSIYFIAIEVHRLKAAGGVDTTKALDAETLVTEYLAFEPDQAKKISALNSLGDIMRLTYNYGKAVAAYRQVLELKPDQYDVMGYLGLCLYVDGIAVEPNDKAKLQEGLNYMQKYTELAPIKDTDPPQVKELKEGIKNAVADLKTRNLTPQKIATPSTKKKNN